MRVIRRCIGSLAIATALLSCLLSWVASAAAESWPQRTVRIIVPIGSGSTTSYLYSGATVTITDAAQKKKVFTTDAMGNLTQVAEDPTGLNLVTTYGYDVLNRKRTAKPLTQRCHRLGWLPPWRTLSETSSQVDNDTIAGSVEHSSKKQVSGRTSVDDLHFRNGKTI